MPLKPEAFFSLSKRSSAICWNVREGFGVYVGGGVCGVRYEGEWHEDLRGGVGVESYGNSSGGVWHCPLGGVHTGGGRCFYDGTWLKGLYDGEGTFTCVDGVQYHGSWFHGKRHGFGRAVLLPKDMQYSMVRGLDGELRLQHVVSLGEHGLGYKLDDAYRCRVYEGFYNKNKRMGLGRVTLNRGEIHEGFFNYGKLNGVVRITFPPSKTRPKGSVSFAMYTHNVRGKWVRGLDLRDREDLWFEEVRHEFERSAAMDKTLKMLSKYGVFKVKDALAEKSEEKVMNETIEKEEREREEEVAKMFKPKKQGDEETPAGL